MTPKQKHNHESSKPDLKAVQTQAQDCNKDIYQKIMDISCPLCESKSWIRRGQYKGKQRVDCRDCKNTYTTNVDYLEVKKINLKPSFQRPPGLECPSCGSLNYRKRGFSEDTGKQRYRCNECNRSFVENPELGHESNYLPLGDDVWSAVQLGYQLHQYGGLTKIVFTQIKQPWLKDIAKKFIKYRAATRKFSTLNSYLDGIRQFSYFLTELYSTISPEKIDRAVILDYIDYLNQLRLKSHRKSFLLSFIRLFFEDIHRNEWLDVKDYLIYDEDFFTHEEHLPRIIPEEVIRQLNEHLDNLPAPVMRMVLVQQELGLRVGELLLLPFNCLKQDTEGSWWIQFMREKTKKETSLPISRELAGVIIEQKDYICKNLQEFNYLFCGQSFNPNNRKSSDFNPKPKVMRYDSFVGFLRRLAQKFEIKTNSGELWHFQTHQFRHTVATRMINNQVPHHIVQRFLGHLSPEMTQVYAHIYDETLKNQIKDFHLRVVNITGDVISSTTPEIDGDKDLQWFKKKVMGEVLPHGYCGLPANLTCSKGNACLQCGHFRTTKEFLTYHKKHKERTEEVLAKAKQNGWTRQIQVNEEILTNLNSIIFELEKDDNVE
ncbi:MAG: tyrosine-type recombinase/integrase [Richelia sp. SL_2_1]|nr:tyrosine-type recombinase/integrase [Richelia sp. SM1_7_0]NJN13259.1 tyrosine-type recombinase/integrase [Richelia sp. RM1_1_1]NJO27420.1 tyrosine-type recombinase/integrase [Richelia sp. SL_2_1]